MTPDPGKGIAPDRQALPQDAVDAEIVRDQLAEAKVGLWVSMPISAALSLLILMMERLSGNGWSALGWFTCVNALNGARLALASGPVAENPQRLLRQFKALALAAGFCWSYLAFLTGGFSHPGSAFHLIILAGICAGAVTYGGSCAPLSINFIAPPLAITAGALFIQKTFESTALGFAVCLFFIGLFRSAQMTEARFMELSRLRREAEEFGREMERSSREDPLTGLLNRRGFEHALTAIGPGGGTFAILGIELDGIKAVNDTYGHRTGDRILAEIAGRIACWAPPAAILARVGGDEFTVLHRIDAAHRLREADVERLIHALTEPYGTAPSARIGASVGVHTTERLDLRELLLHADAALTAAKSHGDNTFYVFDDELRDSLQRRQDVERDIPAAIGKGELTAWFQPVVRLDRLEVVGFEALLRWTHPVHGPIPPPEIVAAARQTGVVQSITRMVFSNCCNLVETLNRTGERRMKVAMNMSPFELEVTDIETTILAELRGRNLSTDQFEIEITEESSLDYERVRGNLRRLSGAGISIALDDFGTGFSTFSSIRNGWISKIKIDKEFVSGSPASPDDTQLVKSIIDLGRALGIEVCAEGVETGETARLLRSLGCTLAQGFLYSKPVPASDVAAAVARIETARPEVAS